MISQRLIDLLIIHTALLICNVLFMCKALTLFSLICARYKRLVKATSSQSINFKRFLYVLSWPLKSLEKFLVVHYHRGLPLPEPPKPQVQSPPPLPWCTWKQNICGQSHLIFTIFPKPDCASCWTALCVCHHHVALVLLFLHWLAMAPASLFLQKK